MKAKTILNIGVVSTFFIVAGTVTLIAVRGHSGPSGPARLMMLGTVPDFRLTESGGAALRLADLRETVWVASFIFTRCAEVCPAMMRKGVELQRHLPLRDDVRLVSFSVDPDYDTPPVLRRYADMFGADRARWLLLTGDKQQIYDLALKGFRLSVQDEDVEMPILHSTKLVLVDRRGVIRGYYDSDDENALRQLARDVRRVLAEKS
jgi:cytochrome oxidase Cu insertion factor (SCO1/SenC/PrrC family)